MNRIVKIALAAATLLALSASIAYAGILKGKYTGSSTEDGNDVQITVAKVDGEKMVTKIVVDQTNESGCGETVLNKDRPIKNGKFVAKEKFVGDVVFRFQGEFVTEGVIAGEWEQVFCDGSTEQYAAYHESVAK